MTSARRQRKTCSSSQAALLGLLGLIAAVHGSVSASALTERIVIDNRSGMALSGFDPVAYFSDHAARACEGAAEYVDAGVVWRFCNEGNRAAFAAHPEIYSPQFGGYDPVALARAVAVPGHPLIWLIAGERLYLFSKPENRDAFAASTEQVIAAAARGWRQVEPTLVP
jgi:YHS domain-containing protein